MSPRNAEQFILTVSSAWLPTGEETVLATTADLQSIPRNHEELQGPDVSR